MMGNSQHESPESSTTPESLIALRSTFDVHCSRPLNACSKCQALHKQGRVYELIAPDANPNDAARMIYGFQNGDGKQMWSPFRVLKRFANKDEALEYGRVNGLVLEGEDD
jgi:hypothetical protein